MVKKCRSKMADFDNLHFTMPNGSGRGNTLKDIAKLPPQDDASTKNMEEMLLDVRVDNAEKILEDYIMMILDAGKKMVSNSRDPKVQNMYKCYQNLWHTYVKRKKISDKMQDKNFAGFFKIIRPRYALIGQ